MVMQENTGAKPSLGYYLTCTRIKYIGTLEKKKKKKKQQKKTFPVSHVGFL